MTVLTGTARLALVLGFVVNLLADGFLVSNLRLTYVSLDLEFTKKSVNDNFKVKLAHTCDNGLTCFFICIALEGGVLFSKLLKADTHLLLSCLSLGLDSYTDNRIREVH